MRAGSGIGKMAAPLAIIFAVFTALVYMAVSRGSNTVQADRNKGYERVMALDFNSDYPESPDGVLDGYCEIDMFLSGNTTEGFTEADLEHLVKMQRTLLHEELLEINPLEEQIQGYSDKIEYLRENEMRLMQLNPETPRFSDDAVMSSIGVKQFWSRNVKIDLVYNLKKEDGTGRWKVIGWYVNEQAEGQ